MIKPTLGIWILCNFKERRKKIIILLSFSRLWIVDFQISSEDRGRIIKGYCAFHKVSKKEILVWKKKHLKVIIFSKRLILHPEKRLITFSFSFRCLFVIDLYFDRCASVTYPCKVQIRKLILSLLFRWSVFVVAKSV